MCWRICRSSTVPARPLTYPQLPSRCSLVAGAGTHFNRLHQEGIVLADALQQAIADLENINAHLFSMSRP